uniref:UBC core domain-containing protein n=1 Tax=Strombidium rassoulzadegani TaxID=1082188 RepID=A0A7S3FT38_9SPIT|mmetsp:Transcript_1557/g.2747  ORF Transcript_1557/g.2747 Transcript_1557/m.2747 type:complete len:156 (+) Transcript_1557:174-641(+)
MDSRNNTKRIIKDYKAYQQQAATLGMICKPQDDDITDWDCVIFGPEDTIWEGGVFKLKIKFPPNYPVEPPKVKFLTQMFHPNIYSSGEICLDILEKDKWSSLYNPVSLLQSLQSLLTDPNCTSPANKEASGLYQADRVKYLKKVRECIEKSWIVS